MRVHQEDIALFKDATTLPIGQQATAKVAFARRPDLKAINTDAETLPANGLAGNRQHTFDEGYATPKVAPLARKVASGSGGITTTRSLIMVLRVVCSR
jgi:hypothetical protein